MLGPTLFVADNCSFVSLFWGCSFMISLSLSLYIYIYIYIYIYATEHIRCWYGIWMHCWYGKQNGELWLWLCSCLMVQHLAKCSFLIHVWNLQFLYEKPKCGCRHISHDSYFVSLVKLIIYWGSGFYVSAQLGQLPHFFSSRMWTIYQVFLPFPCRHWEYRCFCDYHLLQSGI